MGFALIVTMFAAPVVVAGVVAGADWITGVWLTRRRDSRRRHFTHSWSERNKP
jgi:uncharacterized protein (DUF2062 family)